MKRKKIRYYGNGYNPSLVSNIGVGVNAIGSGLGTDRDGSMNAMSVLGSTGQGVAAGAAFGPVGAAIGGAIGFVGGIFNKNKRDAEIQRQKEAEHRMNNYLQIQHSKAVLADYPTEGRTGNTTYYNYGGKRKYEYGGKFAVEGVGGTLQPLASNVTQAKGNTHAEGGIQLDNINVENNEVAASTPTGEVWFSDKLKTNSGVTFAKEAERIGRMKGKAEEDINSTNRYKRGTAERKLQVADQQMLALEAAQMVAQTKAGVPHTGTAKAEFGTKLNEGISKGLPYLDNIANAFITAKTPNIPTPRPYKTVPIDTDININAQLEEIRRSQRDAIAGVQASSTDAGTIRANMIGVHAAGIDATNKLYEYETNAEKQLKNQERINNQQVVNQNVQQANQYDLLKTERIDDIHGRISANVADAATNAMQQVQEDRLERRDLAEIELLKAKYRESGVWDRNLGDAFDKFTAGEISYEEFKALTREAEELLRRKQQSQRIDSSIKKDLRIEDTYIKPTYNDAENYIPIG